MFQCCRGKSGYFKVIEFKAEKDLVKKIIPSLAGDTVKFGFLTTFSLTQPVFCGD